MQQEIAATEEPRHVGIASRLAFAGKLILFAIVMLVAWGLSNLLVGGPWAPPAFHVPLWLPTGIGLGVFLVGGLRYWPGIPLWGFVLVLLSLVGSTIQGESLLEAWGFYVEFLSEGLIMLGEVFAAHWLVRPHVSLNPSEPLFRKESIPRLIGAIVSVAVLGKLTLILYYIATIWAQADSQLIWYFWGKHVLGDVLGILLATPPILAVGRWCAKRYDWRVEGRD